MPLSTLIADKTTSIVVVVDIQQRLLTAMPTGSAESLVKQSGILLQAAKTLAIPQLVSEQYPRGLGATVADLQPYIEPDNIIEKMCFSCAQSEPFTTKLRASKRNQVMLIGMEAHICVLQTALELQRQGYQVFVIADAVCSRTQENKINGLQRLQQAGIIISNVESVLFEWLGDAQQPEFKSLAKLIV